MTSTIRRGAPVALTSLIMAAVAGPAAADLLTEKSLSLAQALTMAQTAAETCKQQGDRVTDARGPAAETPNNHVTQDPGTEPAVQR